MDTTNLWIIGIIVIIVVCFLIVFWAKKKGHIKEPKGVVFIISSEPLTEKARNEISTFIHNYKNKGSRQKVKIMVFSISSLPKFAIKARKVPPAVPALVLLSILPPF